MTETIVEKLETEGDGWLDGADLCLHLGILPAGGTEVRDIIERVNALPLTLTDGDSFTEWGEALRDGHPVHVLVRIESQHGIPNRETVTMLRDYLAKYIGGRVVDYYVTTDAQDWSEGAVVTGFYA